MKLFNRLLAGLVPLALLAQPALAVPQPTPAPINDVTNKTVTPAGGPSDTLANLIHGSLTFASHSALTQAMTLGVIGAGTPSVYQQAFYANVPGGAARYDWFPNDTETADGLLVMLAAGQSAGTPGRFVMEKNGNRITNDQVGITCDNPWNSTSGTDWTTSLNNVLSALQNNSQSGGILTQSIECAKSGMGIKVAGAVNFGRGTFAEGVGMPLTTTGGNAHAFVPFFMLTSTGSIKCNPSSGLRDLAIVKAGIPEKLNTMEDAYAYQQTTIQDGSAAIANNGSDCNIERVATVGFQNGLTSTGGARLILDRFYVDGFNGGDVQHNADNTYITRTRQFPFYTSNLGSRLGVDGATPVGAGTGYTDGDLLTVSGGTLTASGSRNGAASQAAVFRASVAGGSITGLTLVDTGDYQATPQTWGAGGVNGVLTPGSGGSNGPGVALTATNTTCATPPTFTGTISSGALASASVATAGSCDFNTLPRYVTVTGGGLTAILDVAVTKNALALTGGTGTGATATVTIRSAAYRGGTFLRIHDQADGIWVAGDEEQEVQNGVIIDNVWNGMFKKVGGEGGKFNYDKQPIAIQTLNCTADTTIENPQSDNNYIGVDLQHLSAANGGACSGGSHFSTNSTASVAVLGAHLGNNGQYTLATVRMGPYSTGSISYMTVGMAAYYPPAVVLMANAGLWRFSNTQFDDPQPGTVYAWLSADPTATPPQSPQFGPPATNILLNGDMRVDQMNEGAGNTNSPRIDRWFFGNQFGANVTSQRVTSPVPAGQGFAEKLTVNASVTPSAAQEADFSQQVEGPFMAPLQWGTSNGIQAVASWWANWSQTGTYTAFMKTAGQSGSLVMPYTITQANTYQLFTRIVPPPPQTSGFGFTTLPYGPAGNNMSLRFGFDMGAGSNYQAPTPNVWLTGNYQTVAGAVEPSTVSGLVGYLSAVHLTPGPFASPYVQRTYNEELTLVRRYFQKSEPDTLTTPAGQNKGLNGAITFFSGAASGTWGEQVRFPVEMANTPTITIDNPSAANGNCYDQSASADVGAGASLNIGTSGFFLYCAGMTAIQHQIAANYRATTGF